MASNPLFITADEVSDLIGTSSGRAFLRQRKDLEDNHGFPQPMPTCQSPLIWRAAQINSWVQEQGRPQTATPAAANGNVFLLREAASA